LGDFNRVFGGASWDANAGSKPAFRRPETLDSPHGTLQGTPHLVDEAHSRLTTFYE